MPKRSGDIFDRYALAHDALAEGCVQESLIARLRRDEIDWRVWDRRVLELQERDERIFGGDGYVSPWANARVRDVVKEYIAEQRQAAALERKLGATPKGAYEQPFHTPGEIIGAQSTARFIRAIGEIPGCTPETGRDLVVEIIVNKSFCGIEGIHPMALKLPSMERTAQGVLEAVDKLFSEACVTGRSGRG